MNQFIFTKKSHKDFEKLQPAEQSRILQKLQLLKKHPDILATVSTVKEMYPITHRLRIGNHRLLLNLHSQTGKHCKFIITQIVHRKEIYRQILSQHNKI